MAKFRLRNEVREGKYWLEKKKRKCRRCGREEETWEHVWERCGKWEESVGSKVWQEQMGRILGPEGKGEKWMRDIERDRQGTREVERVGENGVERKV